MIAPATTVELPRDLAPWRQELDLFPADLVLSLQGPLRRLRSLLGSLASSSLHGGGDPDGYQDLARRGPYERLVASEWLLADVVPEEFDRRAAMGEHLFLELAYRSPRPRGRWLVLFDAGPDQLGAPRVAQLALLILLAGRARVAGSAFQWGLVQRPDTGPVSEVTKDTVLSFLEGRSPEPATARHLEGWRPHWGERGADDDLWLVGGDRLTSRAAGLGASALTIDDPLVAGQRSLQVRADRPGTRSRTVELELPAEPSCVRMLRDPFAISVAERDPMPTRPDVGGGLMFAAGGNRLLVRQANGSLVAYHVPSSARDKSGHPRRLQPSPGDELVAGGFRRGSLLAVTLSGHTLTVHGVPWPGAGRPGGKLVVGLPPGEVPTPPGRTGRFGLCYFAPTTSEARSAMAIVDAAGQAIEIAPGHLETLGDPGARVVAADASGDRLVLIVDEGGRQPGATPWALVHWWGAGTASTMHSGLSWAPDLAPVFGHGTRVYGVASGAGAWQVVSGTIERELHPGNDCRPVAVSWADGPNLVILEDDLRTFSLAGLRDSRILLRSDHEVAAAVGCCARPIFAFLTTAGELTAYAIPFRSVFLRIGPTEDA